MRLTVRSLTSIPSARTCAPNNEADQCVTGSPTAAEEKAGFGFNPRGVGVGEGKGGRAVISSACARRTMHCSAFAARMTEAVAARASADKTMATVGRPPCGRPASSSYSIMRS